MSATNDSLAAVENVLWALLNTRSFVYNHWGECAEPGMGKLEKTIDSKCGHFKAKIERRPGGSVQVTIYRWTEEWVPGYGKVAEFWEKVSERVTITDTVENAEKLACEEFHQFGVE